MTQTIKIVAVKKGKKIVQNSDLKCKIYNLNAFFFQKKNGQI